MSGYGAIPSAEGGSAEPAPGVFAKFMAGDFAEDVAHERNLTDEQKANIDMDATLKYRISPESVRFVAYMCFWFMCFFAITMNGQYVAPYLENNPYGETCGPFAGNATFNVGKPDEYTIERKNGFNPATESHLMEAFSFNNICANWDYSPSREFTAAVYPLFEYSLLIYIVTDYWLTYVSYKKGFLSTRYWNLARVFFPLNIFLCAMFRLIFVVIAYINVSGHTFGFLCLQIALMSVATLNVFYVIESGVSYPFLGGVSGTRTVAWVYLIFNLAIGAVKLYLTAYVVFGIGMAEGNVYPPLFKNFYVFGNEDMPLGRLVDLLWMIFNALLPVIIALVRSQSEPPITIEIDVDMSKYGYTSSKA